jgi:transposase-like protein
MSIRPELLDELLKECENPEELLGQNGLLKELTKGLVERMLHAEMTNHLGYEKHATEGHHSGNSRNGFPFEIGGIIGAFRLFVWH